MILFTNPYKKFSKNKDKIIKKIDQVISSSLYINGHQVRLFEKEFALFNGSKFALGVANGTQAIEIILRGLNIGVGDEVITVSHTAIATVAAIKIVGAKPILVDIEKYGYNIDCNEIKKSISKKTKAIIAVHLYGIPADLENLIKISKKYKIKLIEDVSQAHGASWNNIKLGNFGIAGSFSFYPTKNLSCIGDGGIITTNNTNLYNKIKKIREYGWNKNRISNLHGTNSRLDEIQAAILRLQLKNLNNENLLRLKIAKIYIANLSKYYDIKIYKDKKGNPVYHLFVIETKNRKKLIEYLANNKIYVGIHYKIPVHKQPIFKSKKLKLINTEYISNRIVSLPIYPELKLYEVGKIIKHLIIFYEKNYN